MSLGLFDCRALGVSLVELYFSHTFRRWLSAGLGMHRSVASLHQCVLMIHSFACLLLAC